MPFPTDDPLSAETIPELLVEAYVMGTLTSEQAQAVEALAHSFPGVAKRIASAQAEILPYRTFSRAWMQGTRARTGTRTSTTKPWRSISTMP
ncbi:MAG TPA: hypothetical protein PLO62_01060 [Candidatus Hydrogenedentes bacterium]|nr:hypothetical protein [Candidatus Hydrogenedentota bacterium]